METWIDAISAVLNRLDKAGRYDALRAIYAAAVAEENATKPTGGEPKPAADSEGG